MTKKPIGSVYAIEGGKRYRGVLTLKDEFDVSFRKTFTGSDPKKLRKRMEQYAETYEAGKPTKRMRVEEVCELAIAACETKGRTEKTVKGYKDLLRCHIKPAIGAVPLDALRPSHVERMLDKMETGPQTKKLCRDFLRSAINRIGMKGGFVATNAAGLADIPKVEYRVRNPIEPDDLAKILKAEPNKVRRALWLFLASTGLRPGEARTLLWADLVKKEDGWWLRLRSSKTQAGLQPIPVPSAVMKDLESIPKTSLYVFPSKNGEPFKERRLIHAWEKTLEKAQLDHTNLYQLRKLFGTVQARKVSDAVLKRLMRHTDIRTTKQYYVGALESDLRSAVED